MFGSRIWVKDQSNVETTWAVGTDGTVNSVTDGAGKVTGYVYYAATHHAAGNGGQAATA